MANQILSSLFQSWMVPSVLVSFYDADELKVRARVRTFIPFLTGRERRRC